MAVTEKNKAPTIQSAQPAMKEIILNMSSQVNFNVTGFDPDGTKPETKWFIDGKFVKISDSLSYGSDCGNKTNYIGSKGYQSESAVQITRDISE